MAVAELTHRAFTTRRPTGGHMIAGGIVAAFVAWVGVMALVLVGWLLPGHLDVVGDRIIDMDRPFDVHNGLGVAPVIGEALVVAVFFGGAMCRLVRTRSGRYPSFFWTAASALAGAVFYTAGSRGGVGWVVTLVLTHQLGFDKGGRPRPSPIRLTPAVWAAVGSVVLVGIALVVAGAISEPLSRYTNGAPQVDIIRVRKADRGGLPAGTQRLRVWLQNRSPRTVTITGVPSVSAAQVYGMRRELTTYSPGGRILGPFAPVRLRPGGNGFVSVLIDQRCINAPVAMSVRYTAGGRSHLTQVSLQHAC